RPPSVRRLLPTRRWLNSHGPRLAHRGLVYTRPMSLISDRIEAYGRWRSDLLDAVERYRTWLSQSELSDPQLQARLARVMEHLRDDRMTVAFVAEFSRGKSELINAVFFAQYGQRVLPSSAGRTTMCPTELLFDATRPSGIRLLPIETRL